MKNLTSAFAIILLLSGMMLAQGNAFSFQGKLNDGANPANGRYDLEFKLFDAVAGGNQIGPTVLRPATTLINGVFSTTLDFGAIAFQNPNATFIEIALKPTGSPNALTILGPRQQLTVVPYASRAQNATNSDLAQNSLRLGGILASDYVTETEGSANYIRNGTQTQSNSNFNISGSGTINENLSVGGNQSLVGNLVSSGNLQITGNARQDINSNGLVKAMLVIGNVNGNYSIIRCYNGVTNSSTGNCGFTLTLPPNLVGVYRIDFGFFIRNRFVSVTPQYGNGSFNPSTSNNGANYRVFSNTSIEVFTFWDGDGVDTAHIFEFTLILF